MIPLLHFFLFLSYKRGRIGTTHITITNFNTICCLSTNMLALSLKGLFGFWFVFRLFFFLITGGVQTKFPSFLYILILIIPVNLIITLLTVILL